MTVLGWLTIFAFAAILTALAPPLGRYMAKVYTRRARVPDAAVLRGPERLLYRCLRRRPEARAGLEGVRQEPDHLLARGLDPALLHPAHADAVELHGAEPAGFPLRAVECDVQHDLVVPHQHELAVLRRRDDDDLLQPDGRADGAELPLRGRRHRRRGRADPRHHRAQRQEPRQLLAGHRPHGPLRAVADLVRRRARAGLQGSIQNFSHYLPRNGISGWRRRSRWARSPRRRRSRSSAPTAAASSTSTPRIRSRTRPAFTNLVEMLWC